MTTTPFVPDNSGGVPFASTVVLDGQSLLLTVMWNVYAQRWYVTIAQQGTALWTGPLIASSAGFPVPLAPGIFSTSMLRFDDTSNAFVVTP